MSINDYTKAEGVSQLPSDETEKQLFIIEQYMNRCRRIMPEQERRRPIMW